MGSYNSVCGVTKTPIPELEEFPVYYGFIIKNNRSSHGYGSYPGDHYSLITPLLEGTYNSYGSVDQLDDISTLSKFDQYVLRNVMDRCSLDGEPVTDTNFKNLMHFYWGWKDKKDKPTGIKLGLFTDAHQPIWIWMANKAIVDAQITAFNLDRPQEEFDSFYVTQFEKYCGTYKWKNEELRLLETGGGFGESEGLSYDLRHLHVFDHNRDKKYNLFMRHRKQFSEVLWRTYLITKLLDYNTSLITPDYCFSGQGAGGLQDYTIKCLETTLNVIKETLRDSDEEELDKYPHEQKTFQFLWDIKYNRI